MANLDTSERAWSLSGRQHIVFRGKGTFHQFHGGVASRSLDPPLVRRWAEYRAIRGPDRRLPDTPPFYLGRGAAGGASEPRRLDALGGADGLTDRALAP